MHRKIVECVPNFSEGRDRRIVDQIVDAIGRGPGIAVLSRTMDADHHRSVVTFAGTPEGVASAAIRGVSKAAELIDLNSHSGVHPRLGAADVVPFVPVEGVTLEDCALLAADTAEEIWRSLRIPVYLYEAAARRPDRVRLENIRRGEFEGLRELARINPDVRPDIGGPELHPTAGAAIVGARKFLIACNINLDSDDVRVAKRIARSIRESSGGLPYVKALGLMLARRGQAQVSMNLTDFEQTPLHVVYEAVRSESKALEVEIAGTEIIGLIPKAAMESAAEFYLKFENFTPDSVLENRIADSLPYSLEDFLAGMSDPARATGGGSAAAIAGAMAASLAVLVCRLSKAGQQTFLADRHFFISAATRDAAAFAPLMKTTSPSQAAIVEAAEFPLEIAERAHSLQCRLSDVLRVSPAKFSSDAETGIGLAIAAERGAKATVRVNLARINDSNERLRLEKRLRALE